MRSETRIKQPHKTEVGQIRITALEQLNQRQFRIFLGLGVLAVIVFFLLTSPSVRTGSDDAYWFALQIEDASISETMSARELLFIPVMKAVFVVARGLGISERAFDVVGVVNAVLAGFVVLLQFLVLNQRLRLNRTTSLLGALLLVVTFGFWRFSTEVEVYPLGLFAAVGLLYVALGNPRRWSLWAGIGALGAVAFLAHGLTAMVSVIAIPVFLIVQRQWRRLAAYGAAFAFLVVLGTYAAYAIADSGDQSYSEFYTSASSSELAISPNLVARGAIGAGQSIISSGFLFAFDGLTDVVRDAAPERAMDDEVFVAGRVATFQLMVMAVTFLAALVLVFITIAVAVPGIHRRRRSAAIIALVAWLATMVLFQVMRSAGSDGPEAWLFATPPLTMLLTVGLVAAPRRSARFGTPLLVALVAVLAVHNALGMAILEDPSRDRNIAKGEWVLANTGPSDLVMTADSSIFARYLRYESDAEIFYLTEAAIAGAEIAEIHARNSSVFLTADVLIVPERIRYRNERAYERLLETAAFFEQGAVLVVSDEFGGIYRYENPADRQ